MICSGVVQTKQAHIGPSGIVGFRDSRFLDFGLEGLGIPGYLVRGLRLDSWGLRLHLVLLRMRRYTKATRKVDPKYRELCKSLPNFRAAVFPGSVWGELLGFRISGFQKLGVPFGGP